MADEAWGGGVATAGHQGRQMSGWFSDPSPELGSPLTFPLQTLGVRMTHPTSVFTTCPEPSTQHERCHLLRVSSSTHVVGQEMEAHTLKTLWAQDYGSEQKLGCGRTPPGSLAPLPSDPGIWAPSYTVWPRRTLLWLDAAPA